MKKGNKKLFLDKDLLYRMINLRLNGYSVTSLAVLFSCDISSIRAQCDKYGIRPRVTVYTIERIVFQAIPQNFESDWDVIEGVRVNPGSNYADYLKKSQYPHTKLV